MSRPSIIAPGAESMLRFEWRSSLRTSDFPASAHEALRLRVTDHTPFNSLGWLIAAEQALGENERLHVLLGWEADELRLCLPLVAGNERFAGLRFRTVHHLGFPMADRLALLSQLDAEHMRQALLLIRQRIPHALLQLNELSEPIGEESVLTQWMAHSSTGERRLSCRVPVHLISDADHQEVSGDPRYKLRRARKRIAACGAQVRRIIPDAVSMGPLLQALREVEAVSWKGDEGVGIFATERSRQWMESAFTALAAEGLIRVVTLELDGRCISYRLGLLEQGRLYDYNLAFLPQHADLGSGRVLLDEWIRWGLEDQWRWIDASRVSLENSSHQLHERMTGRLEHWRWSFYSWRPSGLLLGFGLRLWHRCKPALQKWRAHRAGKPTAAITQTATVPEQQPANAIHNTQARASEGTMNVIEKLRLRIRQKGLRHTLGTLWKRYVFAHRELLWMERDLVSPVAPHKLRPYEGLRKVDITEDNAKAFTRYFGGRVQTMAELAAEGHTGHMYLDQDDHAVAFIWGSKRDYYDRHFYGCTFPVKPGEFFEFGGEMTPPYFGCSLSVDAQVGLWQAMAAQGCDKVVDVCDNANTPAMKLHLRMGYLEQGRITHVYDLFGHWRFFRETHYSGSRLDALRKPERPVVSAAAQA